MLCWRGMRYVVRRGLVCVLYAEEVFLAVADALLCGRGITLCLCGKGSRVGYGMALCW